MTQALFSLCHVLRMPQPVTDQILRIYPELPLPALQAAMEQLFHPETWDSGLAMLKQQLGEDPRGMKMLTCMLHCALKTRKHYEERNIPNAIFLATMDCFPRFVREHMESFGCYGFDRDFWTVRQLSGVLFRIGLLEYEFQPGTISLHIPSGARLVPEMVDESLEQARNFATRFFPEWKAAPMCCHSWLLSPDLSSFLPNDSNIMRFQKRFQIISDEENQEFLTWIFKSQEIPYPQLPENTRLQRTLKQHLLQGGSFHEGRGTLL